MWVKGPEVLSRKILVLFFNFDRKKSKLFNGVWNTEGFWTWLSFFLLLKCTLRFFSGLSLSFHPKTSLFLGNLLLVTSFRFEQKIAILNIFIISQVSCSKWKVATSWVQIYIYCIINKHSKLYKQQEQAI